MYVERLPFTTAAWVARPRQMFHSVGTIKLNHLNLDKDIWQIAGQRDEHTGHSKGYNELERSILSNTSSSRGGNGAWSFLFSTVPSPMCVFTSHGSEPRHVFWVGVASRRGPIAEVRRVSRKHDRRNRRRRKGNEGGKYITSK